MLCDNFTEAFALERAGAPATPVRRGDGAPAWDPLNGCRMRCARSCRTSSSTSCFREPGGGGDRWAWRAAVAVDQAAGGTGDGGRADRLPRLRVASGATERDGEYAQRVDAGASACAVADPADRGQKLSDGHGLQAAKSVAASPGKHHARTARSFTTPVLSPRRRLLARRWRRRCQFTSGAGLRVGGEATSS